MAATIMLFCLLMVSASAWAQSRHFVPNNINFWYNSAHWSTNFGPAFRDTVLGDSYMLPCTGQFALCFHSGAEPLPCKLTPDGKYANCTCTVGNATNYVLMTAILNYKDYQDTVTACGSDGSECATMGSAPVCAKLPNGKLISGAELISTYDSESWQELVDAIAAGAGSATACDGTYAACMTAPCKLKKDGTAVCTCPVFHGRFQLLGTSNVCSLGGNLVPSAGYVPILDSQLPN